MTYHNGMQIQEGVSKYGANTTIVHEEKNGISHKFRSLLCATPIVILAGALIYKLISTL